MIVVVVIAVAVTVAAAAAGNAIGALRIADSLFRCFLQVLLQILENLLHCIRWRWQFLIVDVVVIVVAIGAVQGKFMSRNSIALRQLLLNWICGIDNGLGMCARYKFHRRSDGIPLRRWLERLYCLQ